LGCRVLAKVEDKKKKKKKKKKRVNEKSMAEVKPRKRKDSALGTLPFPEMYVALQDDTIRIEN